MEVDIDPIKEYVFGLKLFGELPEKGVELLEEDTRERDVLIPIEVGRKWYCVRKFETSCWRRKATKNLTFNNGGTKHGIPGLAEAYPE